MKKIYTKPSLHAETFAVEDIMTEAVAATAFSAVRSLYLDGQEIGGTINFTNSNVYSINYEDFDAAN